MSLPAQLLVVEDDPALARAIARALRAAGHEVVTARSRAEAQAAGSFDVAVLDIDLGEESGLQLAKQLLASGRARAVVFHSGTRKPEEQARASELGVLVGKSGDMTALLDAVTRALQTT